MKVMFVTWDGPQSAYLESLFVPIFRKLAEKGLEFHILQFTWAAPPQVERFRRICEEAGFTYQAIKIWRRPKAIGALLTAVQGVWRVKRAMRVHAVDIILPRSTLPALAVLLAVRGENQRIVFDADGLPLDERVEFAEQSASGLVYRLLRDVEAQAVRRSDRVLVRSSKAAEILLARAGAGTKRCKFSVVGNGRDGRLFKPLNDVQRTEVRAGLGVGPTAPLLIYAGSMGPKYRLTDMLELFEVIRVRRPDAQFVILTGSPELVTAELEKRTLLRSAIQVRSVPSGDVPFYLASADLGLALIEQTYSMQAATPIKLGEYLLCGLPVILTGGIGDSRNISPDCGFVLETLGPSEIQSAANWFVDRVLPCREAFRVNCRRLGEQEFSIEASVASYMRALSSVDDAT